MTTPSARDRILDTASRLFYRDGYRATGIDKIIAESGVAKMSLYRHFPSKNDLIFEYLQRRHDFWMAWFQTGVSRRLATRRNLDVVADTLGEWFAGADFRGCSFINMVAETGGGAGDDPRLLEQAVSHKASLQAFVVDLARDLELSDAEAVAEEAILCIEGMIVRAQTTHDAAVVDAGRRTLCRLHAAFATPVAS